ncbi:hypothetical protein GQX74_007313 [Glossina fuscipes]|nr:hypothetical protein GQX74_007313 [Glossina fuscipes]
MKSRQGKKRPIFHNHSYCIAFDTRIKGIALRRRYIEWTNNALIKRFFIEKTLEKDIEICSIVDVMMGISKASGKQQHRPRTGRTEQFLSSAFATLLLIETIGYVRPYKYNVKVLKLS